MVALKVRVEGINMNKGFRLWLNDKWFEHVDECLAYNIKLDYTSDTFFKINKWHLKRLYKAEKFGVNNK